ncbi:MAG: bacterial Ig-like domain-containing protein [Bacilli bacterium]|nr:bacterial Ig-like domain-containing protein [Bacilli bacterium]
MKKITKLGIVVTSLSLLTGVSAVTISKGSQFSIATNADYNYNLVLNSANYSDELTFSVQTTLGNSISFEKSGITAVAGMFGSFKSGAMLRNVDDITGIGSVTINFKEGETGSIAVTYSLNGTWVSSISLNASNPTFNFNGVEPSSIILENTTANAVVVQSIKIGYSCVPSGHSYTSLEVTTNPTKTVYDTGDDFDPTGMVVSAVCGVDGHNDKVVVNDYRVVNGTELAKGTTSVTVKYGSLETSVPVTVRDLCVIGEVGMVEYAATASGSSTFEVIGLTQVVNSIKVGENTYTEGFSSVANGFTVENSILRTALGTATYGDVELTLVCLGGDEFRVTVSVVTKILRTVNDLTSLHISSGNLNGYFALENDIECSSTLSFKILENYNQEFTGIFDGKGHALKNLNVNDMGLFRGTFNKATVRNVAFVNLRTAGGTYKRPLGCTADGKAATFENVLLDCSNASQFIAGPLGAAHHVKNCVLLMPGSTKLFDSIGVATNLQNTFVVGGANQTHASVDALLAALDNNDAVFSWDSKISYSDGSILICGNPVYDFISYTCSNINNEVSKGDSVTLSSTNANFSLVNEIPGVTLVDGVLSVADTVAENTEIQVRLTHKTVATVSKVITIKVINLYEEITLDEELLLDLSKDNTVIPVELEGNVTSIRRGSISNSTGFSYTDGNLTVSKTVATSLLAGQAYGENIEVEIVTSAKKIYTVKMTFATRLIGSADDLKLVTGNTVSGLYILTRDIDGSTLAGYKMLINWGDKFTGIFDGRGHVIYDAVVNDMGFFRGNLDNAIVRNIGFKNLRHNGTSYMRAFGDSVVNSTIENVYVEAPTSKNFFAGAIDEASSKKVKNVVMVFPVAEKFVDSTYRANLVNCFMVASYADGGTSKTFKTHNTTAELLADLEAGTISLPAPYSYADGHLSFGGTVVL